MKFRNPETGEVFEDMTAARFAFCRMQCKPCPISCFQNEDETRCDIFCCDHPREAARLMGYEVVEEGEKPTWAERLEASIKHEEEANMDKPRICEVLGVEVGQSFKLKGADMGFYVDRDGIVKREEDDASIGLPEICLMINHPDRIIRKPCFTDQEVERAKAIKVLFPDANAIIIDGSWTSLLEVIDDTRFEKSDCYKSPISVSRKEYRV